ncbi:MAG TPA: sugar ABC transporter permease, partial [Mariniphaga sp.]|nr:sugar ABC transporter permease [Mariniphaga sp.]
MKPGKETNRIETTGNKGDRIMAFMLGPAVIFVFVVSIIPLLYTFYLSFQNYILTNPSGSYFNGLKNYIKLFTNPVIRQSISKTLIFTFSSVALSMFVGLGLALVVNNIKKGKTFFRIALFIPMMLSPVVIGVVWRFLFNNEMGV